MKIKFISVPPSAYIPTGSVSMYIPALKKLQERRRKYEKDHKWGNKNAYFKAYLSFLDWVIQYVNSEIGATKRYTIDQLISVVYNTKKISNAQSIRQLDYYLYLCKQYAEKLKSQAKMKCVPNYIKSAWLFMYDVEELVSIFEFSKKKSTSVFPLPTMGVRNPITPMDLKFAANELTYLPEIDKLESLDFRDIQPCSIMIIRQAIELLGKNLIGYQSITDANGGVVKQMTQIAWSFLKENMGKSSWTITLPIQLSNIVKVNKWANGYVHNPWINKSYIRAFGLEVLWELMKPSPTGIKCYNGKTYTSFLFGDFQIQGYNQLKQDFCNYVASKKAGATIDWLPIDKVGAYIISL